MAVCANKTWRIGTTQRTLKTLKEVPESSWKDYSRKKKITLFFNLSRGIKLTEGGGTQTDFMRGGYAPRFKSLLFYAQFFLQKR